MHFAGSIRYSAMGFVVDMTKPAEYGAAQNAVKQILYNLAHEQQSLHLRSSRGFQMR